VCLLCRDQSDSVKSLANVGHIITGPEISIVPAFRLVPPSDSLKGKTSEILELHSFVTNTPDGRSSIFAIVLRHFIRFGVVAVLRWSHRFTGDESNAESARVFANENSSRPNGGHPENAARDSPLPKPAWPASFGACSLFVAVYGITLEHRPGSRQHLRPVPHRRRRYLAHLHHTFVWQVE